MIPWNPAAPAQDHLAAAREGLPCEDCGGAGWFFGGAEYPLGACASCNDDEQKPRPRALKPSLPLARIPEPWVAWRGFAGWVYHCGQCSEDAILIKWPTSGFWWACRCLAAAETETGVVVLKFPQPVRIA